MLSHPNKGEQRSFKLKCYQNNDVWVVVYYWAFIIMRIQGFLSYETQSGEY